MRDISVPKSNSGSVADSAATSNRLVAAAESVRRKKVFAKLEVEEAEIEVELAAVRSAGGSQASSVRRRNLGNLSTDALALRSPEPLQNKIQRLQDSTAQMSFSSGLRRPFLNTQAATWYPERCLN